VDVLNQIPILVLNVLEADIAENTSVVDEDIDAAEGLDSSIDDFLSVLDAVVVGNSLSAVLLDLIDNYIGSLWNKLQR
jgi:hypothetical protein